MKREQVSIVLAGISTAALLAACGAGGSRSPITSPVTDSLSTVPARSTDAMTPSDRSTASSVAASEAAAEIVAPQGSLAVTIGTTEFSATLADTDTARAFADRLPLTLDMSDVNNNEKAYELAEALPDAPEKPGKVSTGDLMLYGSNTIVLSYESFDTTYAYTRIGRLDAPDGVAKALGAGDVTVIFASP